MPCTSKPKRKGLGNETDGQGKAGKDRWHLTHSLPRVINFKFPLQPHQKYYIAQYEELELSNSKMWHPELVEKELRNLNTNKAPGWDAISPRILKLSAEALAPSLIQIFNTCIHSGQWPATWKMGQWLPVFKRDGRTVLIALIIDLLLF